MLLHQLIADMCWHVLGLWSSTCSKTLDQGCRPSSTPLNTGAGSTSTPCSFASSVIVAEVDLRGLPSSLISCCCNLVYIAGSASAGKQAMTCANPQSCQVGLLEYLLTVNTWFGNAATACKLSLTYGQTHGMCMPYMVYTMFSA